MFAEELPMDWYSGFGTKRNGIRNIAYTETLTQMGDGAVGRHMGQYDHYVTHFSAKGKALSDEGQRAVEEARRVVKELTGFSAEQIRER